MGKTWTANQHIIRVVPANNDVAGYISIFLSSDYGYELIKRFTYGSVVDEIDDNHVRQIQITYLEKLKIFRSRSMILPCKQMKNVIRLICLNRKR